MSTVTAAILVTAALIAGIAIGRWSVLQANKIELATAGAEGEDRGYDRGFEDGKVVGPAIERSKDWICDRLKGRGL